MTDSENQRQRHLAEMMIAQCNGKQVQYRERDGEWIAAPYMIYNIADSDKLRLQWRIRPEPREWWICEKCNTSLDERFAAHPSRDGKTFCEGKQADLRKSREVLEP